MAPKSVLCSFGMISEFLSAKMERVLTSLRVQSYNTKERIPNYLANLWRFEKLKTAHSPSVYWGKIIFLYRNGVQISKIHLTQKNDTSAKLTIAPDTALFVHFWLQSKNKLLGQNYEKKGFSVCVNC